MHELTEKIRFYLGTNEKILNEADLWIKRWLREKAKEICGVKRFWFDFDARDKYVNELLGLSAPSKPPKWNDCPSCEPEEEHLNYCQYPEGHECTCKPEKEAPNGDFTIESQVYIPGEKECIHCKTAFIFNPDWKCCPFCMNLRPVKEVPVGKSEWCEHIKTGSDQPYPTTLYYPNAHYRSIFDDDMFCAVCCAPRPKPKTLAEEFDDYIGAFTDDTWPKDWSRRLAVIAEAHFKESHDQA